MREEQDTLFVDLFAGCGGLSLGLLNAGWLGYFAIEKDPLAFKTLSHNLLHSEEHFQWPEWLPQEPHDIGEFNQKYWYYMKNRSEDIDLVAAGPPCQGFSYLGRRNKDDNRNSLFERFIKVVDLLEPRYLLLENVPGITVEHGRKKRKRSSRKGRPPKPYSHRIRDRLLENHGYRVFGDQIKAEDCGVAQRRPRFFLVGIRKDLLPPTELDESTLDPFVILEELRPAFLQDMGLSPSKKVSTREAISDLETEGKQLVPCPGHTRHNRIVYEGPETDYQAMLHRPLNGRSPNSLRLVNHRESTVESFRKVQKNCRRGVSLNRDAYREYGVKKHYLTILDPSSPAHTISTLPDDQLHYSEPRVLTVREYARLQSFPDWFAFKGKYTTGGRKRTEEAPRYTQVGNAVAPFVAELFGRTLHMLDRRLERDG